MFFTCEDHSGDRCVVNLSAIDLVREWEDSEGASGVEIWFSGDGPKASPITTTTYDFDGFLSCVLSKVRVEGV